MKIGFQNRLFLLIISLVILLIGIILVVVNNQFTRFSQTNLETGLATTERFFQEYIKTTLLNKTESHASSRAFAPRFIAAISTNDSLTILQKAEEEQADIGCEIIIVTDQYGNPLAAKYEDQFLLDFPIQDFTTIPQALSGDLASDMIIFDRQIFQVASAPVRQGGLDIFLKKTLRCCQTGF